MFGRLLCLFDVSSIVVIVNYTSGYVFGLVHVVGTITHATFDICNQTLHTCGLQLYVSVPVRLAPTFLRQQLAGLRRLRPLDVDPPVLRAVGVSASPGRFCGLMIKSPL